MNNDFPIVPAIFAVIGVATLFALMGVGIKRVEIYNNCLELPD